MGSPWPRRRRRACGRHDTHALTFSSGSASSVVPALLWSVAIVVDAWRTAGLRDGHARRALCCGVSWFAGISPIVLAAPLTVVVATVLWLPHELRKREVALALGSCAVLVATYETAVLLSAVLAGWALWRASRARSPLDRYGCLAAAALSALAVVVAAVGTGAGRNPTHSQSFLYFVVSLEPWPFYVALCGIGAVIAALGPWLEQAARRVASRSRGRGARRRGRGDPARRSYFLRGSRRSGGRRASPRALPPVAVDRRATARDCSGPLCAALLVGLPLGLTVALTLANVRPVMQWSRSLDAFRDAANATSGLADVTTVVPPDRREVVWGWTGSSLSLIVRSDPGSGVLVDPDPTFVPFPPDEAREQLPDRYVWRCAIPVSLVTSRAPERTRMRRHRTTAVLLVLAGLAAVSTTPASGRESGAVPRLVFPLVAKTDLWDNYGDPRPNGRHAGIDMENPWHAPVVAVEDGSVEVLGLRPRRLHALPLRPQRHDVHVHPPEQRPHRAATTTRVGA